MPLNPINSDNINDILENRKHHLSVHEISQMFMTNENCSFKFVTKDQGREEIINLDGSQATPIGNTSLDIMKSTVNIHLTFITISINLSIEKVVFLKNLSLLKLDRSSKRKMS